MADHHRAYTGRVLQTGGIPVGTCFQVSPGILVTAEHVVARVVGDPVPGSSVEVDTLDGGHSAPAVLLASDPRSDLAILQREAPFPASVPGLVGSGAVTAKTGIVISGVAEIPDDHAFRYSTAAGEWQGDAERADRTTIVRVEAGGVMPGMSGAPVRRASDDHVVGVVTGRYNPPDNWMQNTVWVARVDELCDLLLTIAGVELSEVLPRRSQIYRVRPAVTPAAADGSAEPNHETPPEPRPAAAAPEPAPPRVTGPPSEAKVQLVRRGTLEFADAVGSLVMTRDGAKLALEHTRTVEIVAVPGGQRLTTIARNYGWLGSGPMQFSPDGRLLATTYSGKRVDIWDTASGSLFLTIPDGGAEIVRFGRDNRTLAVSKRFGPIQVFALVEGTPVVGRFIDSELSAVQIQSFDYSADGTRIAATMSHSVGSGSDHYVTRIWELSDLTTPRSVRIDDDRRLYGLTFSPDGKYLATAYLYGADAQLWDSATGKLVASGRCARAMMAFSSPGILCLGVNKGEAFVDDFLTGRRIAVIKQKDARIDRLAVSERAHVLAVGGGKSCQIWHVAGAHDAAASGSASASSGDVPRSAP